MKKHLRFLVLSALLLTAYPVFASGIGPGGNDPPPPSNTTSTVWACSTTGAVIATLLAYFGL